MKKRTSYFNILLALFMAVIFTGVLQAQLTGTKTIPGDYATLLAAITDLNTVGVGSGGVTFNIAAGYTETAANLMITATGTSSNPIVFQKNGAGANPLITAGVGVSTTLDGIIKLSGTDYITFDGIDMIENAANTTTTTQTEWGFALLKSSVTDGCRYVTIKNCTITLNKTNTATVGIYSANHTSAATTALVITDTLGSNSYNKFLSNVISNVNSGITITGYVTATPYILYDQNNEVGTTGIGQNRIYNYGTSTTAYGVYGIYQNNIKIYNSNINNSGGAASTSTLYGIFLSTGVNSNVDIFGDTITVVSGGTSSQQNGINNAMGSTGTSNTVNIYNNVIQNCSYATTTSATTYYLYQSASCYNMNIYGNKIINNVYGSASTTSTGTIGYLYTLGGTATNNTWQIYNNTIANNSRVQSVLGTGTTYGLYNGASGPNLNVYGNVLTDLLMPNTSTNYLFYLASSIAVNLNCYNNTVKNITRNASSGATYCYYLTGGTTGGVHNIYNNSLNNLTLTTTGATYCLYSSAAVTKNIYQDTVYNINSSGGSVYGLYQTAGVTTNMYRNRIYGLSSTSGTIYGAYILGGTTNYFYNNYISDLKATTATGAISIAGLYISSGTNDYAFFNTIYLNASSTSIATFGTAGIYASTTPIIDLRNNIVVNLSTPGPTGGFTSAYMRNSATLTTYAAESNNNVFYAGSPSPTRLIYNDGTNQFQSVDAFKTLVAPRDNNSFAENPPFLNVSTTPYDLHISTVLPTGIEGAGIPVNTPIAITTDYDNQVRNITTPDIGADEGNFTFGDVVSPVINYTPLSHTTSTSNRSLTAVITDNISLQINAPNDPRIYYKKGFNGTFKYRNKTTSAGNNFTFDLVVDSVGGLVLGDTVYYYVAAQDLGTAPASPNCGTNPVGGSGVNPPGTGAPSSTNKYIVVDAPMTGVYTVGLTLFNRVSGKNLVSVKKTRTVIKEIPVYDESDGKKDKLAGKNSDRSGVIAPVDNTTGFKDENVKTQKVEVTEEYYELTENGRVYNSFEPAEISREDLFKNGIIMDGTEPLAGIFPTITAAFGNLSNRGVQGAVSLMLLDADYPNETYPLMLNSIAGTSASNTITLKPSIGVTPLISGSQNSGGILRIINTPYVTIDGSNTVNGTTRDLSIYNNSTTSPSVLNIGSLGTTPVTNVTVKNCNLRNGANTSSAVVVSDGTALGTAGYFSNITVQNNLIQRAYMGIYTQGGTIPQNGTNINYIGNSLDSTGIYSIRYIGIYMQGVNGGLVAQNTLGNFDGATSEDDKGMWLATGSTNINVERNKIYNLNYLGTGGYSGHGVYITTTLTGAGINVYNNMISNLSGDGWSYTSVPTDNTIGIALPSAQTGINIYHNSINFSGNTLNQTSAMSMGIYLGTGAVADIKGNIIVNNLGLLLATGYGSAAIYAVTAASQFTDLNYNDYYINPTGTGLKIFGVIASTTADTLAEWRIATGKDVNSVSGDPQYLALNDLHINTAIPTIIESRSVPIAGVTIDYDGETRNATTPDIGADEGSFIFLMQAPPAPLLLLPVNGAVNQSITPLMDWNAASFAASYRILISKDSLFGMIVLDSSGITATALTVPAGKLSGDSSYYWKVTALNDSGSASSQIWNFRTAAQVASVNLTVIPGGFYNTGTGRLNMRDTIKAYLVDSATCLKVDSAIGIVDSVTFAASVIFANANSGNYYMLVYHRNHLAVASRFETAVTRGSTVSYNFTTDSARAFGFNMIKVSSSPVRWAMIPGDANKDGFTDGLDQTIWIGQSGLDGYLSADFNGDTFVDGFDQTAWILFSGNSSFLPCGFFLDPVTGTVKLNTSDNDAKKSSKINYESSIKKDKDSRSNHNNR